VLRCLAAINPGIVCMLDWLKRKAPPVPGEQLLEGEGQAPLAEERLGRLLGRLGSDTRTPDAPAAQALKLDPPPGTARMTASEPVAQSQNELDSPPSADSGADVPVTLRHEDLTITHRGQGPSAAELLAKGYTFATGPDGKMVVFDAEGNLTDTALPRPSTDSSAAIEPAAAVAEQARDPLPSAAREPAAEALQESDSLPSAAIEPEAEALQESDPLPSAASEPATETLQESDSLPCGDRASGGGVARKRSAPADRPQESEEACAGSVERDRCAAGHGDRASGGSAARKRSAPAGRP